MSSRDPAQNQMTEATEKGDYKKLRVFRDTMGINLGFMFSAINVK